MRIGDWARIQKTGPGRLFGLAGICAAVYLFAPLYLLQFLALFALFVILGARLYSECLIRKLRVIRRDREIRCFRFEWTDIELIVENTGPLPAFMLAMGDWPGDLAVFKDHKRLATLPGRSRLAFTWRAYCSERCIGSLGPAQLRCSDPLGIFPFAATAEELTHLVVYPAPGMIGIPNPGGIPLGKLSSRNPLHEDLTRRRSLREYRSGDEPRRINWKASIRGLVDQHSPGNTPGDLSRQAFSTVPSLLVNEYEAAISYPLVVFLNLDPYEYTLSKRELWFERAIEAAAALCLMASRDRQDLGIILYTPWGDEVQESGPTMLIKPSPFTLLPILERLAAIKRPRGPETQTGQGATPRTAGQAVGQAVGQTADQAADQIADQAAGDQSFGTLQGSTRSLLDQGKRLPYGTRLVYTGPELPEEDYIALNTLRAYRLSLEYLVLDERRLSSLAPGSAPRYQMREGGYDIL
ncbi:MAG: DUF58 domain-containing protein [Treponema sp.]|jgi:uncharacterized protein (DUF58 family)|nr:DUF58 domain-containing protein [Treponema sp.]